MSNIDPAEAVAYVERLRRIRATVKKAMAGNKHAHAVTPLLRSDANFLVELMDSLTQADETKS